jgi:hypothetical protein
MQSLALLCILPGLGIVFLGLAITVDCWKGGRAWK